MCVGTFFRLSLNLQFPLFCKCKVLNNDVITVFVVILSATHANSYHVAMYADSHAIVVNGMYFLIITSQYGLNRHKYCELITHLQCSINHTIVRALLVLRLSGVRGA